MKRTAYSLCLSVLLMKRSAYRVCLSVLAMKRMACSLCQSVLLRKRTAYGLCLSVLLLGGLLAPTPVAAQDTLRAAAVVNDEVISMLDLVMRIRLAILSAGLEDKPEVRNRLRPQILRTLIDERLQLQEAVRLDLSATDAEVSQAISRIAGQNNMDEQTFLRFLQQNGVLPMVLQDQIRAGLSWRNVINARIRPTIQISDEEVDGVIRRIQANSGSMEHLVSEIFLAVDNVVEEPEVFSAAERLVQQIRAGADFAALARQFSQSATSSVGGDLGWVREGQLPDEVNNVLRKLRPGQLSPPVQTFGGVYILWLRDQRQNRVGDVTLSLKQILFAAPQGASDQTLQEAITEAAATRADIANCGEADQVIDAVGAPGSGDLGDLNLSDLPPALRRSVANLPIGQPSEPIRLAEGVALLVVCDRSDGSVNRDRIFEAIAGDRINLDARRYLRDLRRAANVDLRT